MGAFDLKRIERDYGFHPANTISGPAQERIRAAAAEFAKVIMIETAPGREQSLALTACEESMFWSNASIIRNG